MSSALATGVGPAISSWTSFTPPLWGEDCVIAEVRVRAFHGTRPYNSISLVTPFRLIPNLR